MTHYEVLGVEVTATRGELRRAYVHLARTFHPDFHADADPSVFEYAQNRMREVNVAWQVLSDDSSRYAYDQRLGLHSESNLHHSGRV